MKNVKIPKKKCFFCGATLTPIYNGDRKGSKIGWWQCSKKTCQFCSDGEDFDNTEIRASNLRKIEKLIEQNDARGKRIEELEQRVSEQGLVISGFKACRKLDKAAEEGA